MIKTFTLTLLTILTLLLPVNARNKDVQTKSGFKGFNFPLHDSIVHVNLGPIEVIGPYRFKNKREERKYHQTVIDVLKTYPLALIVSNELKIVNEQFEVLHTFGDVQDYFKIQTGKMVNDISKMAIRELSVPLSTGIQKVFRQRNELRLSLIHI